MEERYLEALDRLNVADVARETGRAYRTLVAYRTGTRRVTEDAAHELVAYIRNRSDALTEAADALAASMGEEEPDGEA